VRIASDEEESIDPVFRFAVGFRSAFSSSSVPSTREIVLKLEAKMIERMRANDDPALKAEKTAKQGGK